MKYPLNAHQDPYILGDTIDMQTINSRLYHALSLVFYSRIFLWKPLAFLKRKYRQECRVTEDTGTYL
jgi:hypothetical protein